MKESHMYIISTFGDYPPDEAKFLKSKNMSDLVDIRQNVCRQLFDDRHLAQIALARVRAFTEKEILSKYDPSTYKIESDENHFMVLFDNGYVKMGRIIEFGIH